MVGTRTALPGDCDEFPAFHHCRDFGELRWRCTESTYNDHCSGVKEWRNRVSSNVCRGRHPQRSAKRNRSLTRGDRPTANVQAEAARHLSFWLTHSSKHTVAAIRTSHCSRRSGHVFVCCGNVVAVSTGVPEDGRPVRHERVRAGQAPDSCGSATGREPVMLLANGFRAIIGVTKYVGRLSNSVESTCEFGVAVFARLRNTLMHSRVHREGGI